MIPPYPNTPALKAALTGLLLLGATAPLTHAQSSLPKSSERAIRPRAKSPEEQAVFVISQKLANIIIPNIEFRATTINDAIEYLRQESRRLDKDPNAETRGINIFLKLPAASPLPASGIPAAPATTTNTTDPGATAMVCPPLPPAPANPRITLTMSHIPLLTALKYVAEQAGLKVKVEPYAVSLVPLAEDTAVLNTTVFRVSPTFIGNITTSGDGRNPLDQSATTPH